MRARGDRRAPGGWQTLRGWRGRLMRPYVPARCAFQHRSALSKTALHFAVDAEQLAEVFAESPEFIDGGECAEMDFMRGVGNPQDGFADAVQSVDEFLGIKKPGIGKFVVCGNRGCGLASVSAWRRGFLFVQTLLSASSRGLCVHGAGGVSRACNGCAGCPARRAGADFNGLKPVRGLRVEGKASC